MPIAGYKNGIPIAVNDDYHEYIEEVAIEGQTSFQLDYDITAQHEIEIDIDGRDQPIENVNWTRDVDLNKINLSEGLHIGSVFKAKIRILI